MLTYVVFGPWGPSLPFLILTRPFLGHAGAEILLDACYRPEGTVKILLGIGLSGLPFALFGALLTEKRWKWAIAVWGVLFGCIIAWFAIAISNG